MIKTTDELRKWSKQQHGNVGFVPPMRALHLVHASLLSQSCMENELTVLSIYVNPNHFNYPQYLVKYPQTWDKDCQIAAENKVDVIFAPQYSDIYFDQYRYKIQESSESRILCGAHRHGHFDGVLTIVMKLF